MALNFANSPRKFLFVEIIIMVHEYAISYISTLITYQVHKKLKQKSYFEAFYENFSAMKSFRLYGISSISSYSYKRKF